MRRGSTKLSKHPVIIGTNIPPKKNYIQREITQFYLDYKYGNGSAAKITHIVKNIARGKANLDSYPPIQFTIGPLRIDPTMGPVVATKA